MEFLSDRGFTRVRADQRRLHREEHRKRGKLGFGINGIAKTDINLHRNSRSRQLGLKFEAYSVVFVFFLDPSPLDRFAGEHNAIVLLNVADFPDHCFDFIDIGRQTSAEQVQVLCGPVRLSCPKSEKCSAFERKSVSMLRASKAIQEAFYCEPPQHPLVIFISALCERKQSGSNGGW